MNKTRAVSQIDKENPAQFGPKEDFKRYPRTWQQDRLLLEKLKIQILFAPPVNSMYPTGYASTVAVSGLNETLCGSPKSRGSRHFDGVATVVAKLFNLIQPTRAYFGQKDFQQSRIIKQMNKDLNMGVKIVCCATVREKDGLALSSRNAYLSKKDRREAPKLYHSLQFGKKLLRSRSKIGLEAVRRQMKSRLRAIPRSKLDYLDIVNPKTLKKAESTRHPLLLAGALWIGKTRLIDHVLLG